MPNDNQSPELVFSHWMLDTDSSLYLRVMNNYILRYQELWWLWRQRGALKWTLLGAFSFWWRHSNLINFSCYSRCLNKVVTQRSRWAFGLLVDQTLFRAFCKEPRERVFFAIREIRSQIEIDSISNRDWWEWKVPNRDLQMGLIHISYRSRKG